MKTFLLLLLAGLALLAGSAASAASRPAYHRLFGVVTHRGAAARSVPRASSSASTARTAFTCGTACSTYEAGIDKYFTDVGAAAANHALDNVYSVATQYSGIAYGSSFGGSMIDTNPFPSNGCNDTDPTTGAVDAVCLNDGQLETEIRSVIAAQGWPTGMSDLFFIFTPSDVGICAGPGNASSSNECSTNAFCAYHSDFLDGGSEVIYGVEPDDQTIPSGGCTYNVQDPNSASLDPTLNTISHEQNEAITDPLGSAWLTSDGLSEIGDLCAWTFGSPIVPGGNYNQVINGGHYWLQEEYSNAATANGGCVQHLGGTASSPDPALHDGVGPLVSKSSQVMLTNTAYAIYWIPGATGVPANSLAPVVSGVPAVGKTLTTSNGGWTNSPTGYAYKWQSCSATGTGCTDIAGATGSSYQVAAADAGHEIRSAVSAGNSSGSSSYVASTPTEPVVAAPATVAAPAVSGIAAVGKTLSTTQGTWTTTASYAYQWLRCSATGSSCSAISGARSSTYKLTSADAGHEIETRVSATNTAGTTVALSAPTAIVLGVPHASVKPQISGTAKVGKALTAVRGTWTNSPARYAYHWLRCSSTGTSCVRISGATRRTYTVTRRDARHRLRVRVTATNAAGSGASTSGTTRTATRH